MSADELQFMVTFFPTQQALTKTERKMSRAELAELIRNTHAATKLELPWLKLAFFGEKRTDHGCLRSNANLRWCSGVELDYDGEKLSFDAAVNILWQANITAIIYTSASHGQIAPRWRILCPFSLGQQPDQRSKHVARIAGLSGNIFSTETWTLSQGFLFGSVGDYHQHRVVEIDGGRCVDQADELDAGAIWKTTGSPAADNNNEAGENAIADSELIRRIISGDGLHCELAAMAARWIARGVKPRDAAEMFRGFMLSHPEHARDDRWTDRYYSINALVQSAADKYGGEQVEHRRAIARLVHRLAEERRPCAEIHAAVLIEAESRAYPSDSAVAMMNRILVDTMEPAHA
jgi:hypothetical protein